MMRFVARTGWLSSQRGAHCDGRADRRCSTTAAMRRPRRNDNHDDRTNTRRRAAPDVPTEKSINPTRQPVHTPVVRPGADVPPGQHPGINAFLKRVRLTAA